MTVCSSSHSDYICRNMMKTILNNSLNTELYQYICYGVNKRLNWTQVIETYKRTFNTMYSNHFND